MEPATILLPVGFGNLKQVTKAAVPQVAHFKSRPSLLTPSYKMANYTASQSISFWNFWQYLVIICSDFRSLDELDSQDDRWEYYWYFLFLSICANSVSYEWWQLSSNSHSLHEINRLCFAFAYSVISWPISECWDSFRILISPTALQVGWTHGMEKLVLLFGALLQIWKVSLKQSLSCRSSRCGCRWGSSGVLPPGRPGQLQCPHNRWTWAHPPHIWPHPEA